MCVRLCWDLVLIKAKKEIISLYPLGKLTLQTCVIEPYQLNIAGGYYLVPRV